jgi:hypothetical protein
MGRPSCCQPSEEGISIAAVAVLAGAAFAYAKIGPAVARIWHLAVQALMIVTLGAVAAAATIVAICLTARAFRMRRDAVQQILLHPVASGDEYPIDDTGRIPQCLACGDTGTVLRAITGSRYQPVPCPQCQPADRAG